MPRSQQQGYRHVLATDCLSVALGALWAGEESGVPKNRKSFYKASDLFLSSHALSGWG